MNCRETRDCIRDFVEKRLELGRQRSFLQHVKSCEDCMYELETGFLIYDGIRKMDAGEDFDFEKDFERRLHSSTIFVKLATRAKAGLLVLIFVAGLSLMAFWFGFFTL